MRKIAVFMMSLVLPPLLLLTGCEEEKMVKESDFPEAIKSWTSTYFPDHPILQVVRERDDFTVTWEVILAEGVYLEFDQEYHITDLSYEPGLPDSVIPEPIVEYVRTHFPQQLIVEWELNKKSQEVSLKNGLELKFSSDGEFLKID